MNSDSVVIPQDVLRSMAELKRRGSHEIMEELERLEPELMEHVIEEVSGIHHALLDTGLASKRVRRISRRVESLVIVAIESLRRAQRRLWDQFAQGERRLAELDPSAAQQPDDPPAAGDADRTASSGS
jgi:hypothetical protein